MINACHGKASGNSKDDSLFKGVVIGSEFFISLFVEAWVLNNEVKNLIGAFPSVLLEIEREISYSLELLESQIVVCSLEIHCHDVIVQFLYKLITFHLKSACTPDEIKLLIERKIVDAIMSNIVQKLFSNSLRLFI